MPYVQTPASYIQRSFELNCHTLLFLVFFGIFSDICSGICLDLRTLRPGKQMATLSSAIRAHPDHRPRCQTDARSDCAPSDCVAPSWPDNVSGRCRSGCRNRRRCQCRCQCRCHHRRRRRSASIATAVRQLRCSCFCLGSGLCS